VTVRDNNASDLVKWIKRAFTESLRAQIRKEGISVSRLAEASRISRSVLSGYLSDDPALPNSVNLVRLARALNCEPGVFLPNLAPGAGRGTMTDVTELCQTMVHDERIREMLAVIAAEQSEFIYYVPATIPEPLKTNAVLEIECTAKVKGDLHAHIRAMRSMLDMPRNGGLLIDEVLLFDIVERRGTYRGLTPSAAEEQLHRILAFSRERFPQWQVKVIRRLEDRIHPCLMAGKSLLIPEYFDYILQIHNAKVIDRVQGRLNKVFRGGTDFLHWHEMHIGPAAPGGSAIAAAG